MTEAPERREGENAALRARVAALEDELAALRKSAESADEPLVAREALLAEAERIAQIGTWFLNLDTGDVKWSAELFHILGFDPVRDAATTDKFFNALHSDDRPMLVASMAKLKATGELTPFRARIVRKDGSMREVLGDGRVLRDAMGKIVRVVGSIVDVTERKLLEEQLRQSHKMEAVGRLAAGVAHDFNNLLSVISGNADLLQEARPDEKLKRIRDAAEVAAALTRQLLAFSRQSVIRPVVLDLGEVVRDTARIIERVIGENIAIRLSLSGERCAVLMDRAQLQQVLLNLAINARDAMPGGGEIRITAVPAGKPSGSPDAEPSGSPGADPSGPAGTPVPGPDAWVKLSVEDTGSGMDEATRVRAFEPFFTTKEPGKGTGLGLYAVLDAVTQAGGRIAMDSSPGKGTVVTIHLPRKVLPSAPAFQAPAEVKGGSESILVVEDHPALRELVRAFLADGGYRVQVVGRPGEAEAVWEREKGAFDLLVTDLVMPEKSGGALAEGLVARKPSLKTLFISGYAQGFGPEKKVEGPYLQKPFTRIELLHMVRAIFDGAKDIGHAGRNGGTHVDGKGHAPPANGNGKPGQAPVNHTRTGSPKK